jgi:hypothetical protein
MTHFFFSLSLILGAITLFLHPLWIVLLAPAMILTSTILVRSKATSGVAGYA